MVALVADSATPATYELGTDASATVTVEDGGGTSLLSEGRRAGAGVLLRRHVQRFSQLTSDAALGRLRAGRRASTIDARATNGSRAVNGDVSLALPGGWDGWSSFRYSDIGGAADGAVWDLYFGADYRSADGGSVLGGLIGYEPGRVTSDGVRLEARHVQVGLYGARRLGERLIFDGALGWGRGRGDLRLDYAPEAITASYRSQRVTVRGDLTGDFGWAEGPLRIAPRIGVLYARERLGAFTDSVGGLGSSDRLWLARVGLGPDLTWSLPASTTTLQLRVNLDAHNLDPSGRRREEISAALEAGHSRRIGDRALLDLSAGFGGLGSGGFSSGSLGLRSQLDF